MANSWVGNIRTCGEATLLPQHCPTWADFGLPIRCYTESHEGSSYSGCWYILWGVPTLPWKHPCCSCNRCGQRVPVPFCSDVAVCYVASGGFCTHPVRHNQSFNSILLKSCVVTLILCGCVFSVCVCPCLPLSACYSFSDTVFVCAIQRVLRSCCEASRECALSCCSSWEDLL